MSDHNGLPNGWGTATISDLIGREGVFCDGDWMESKDQDPNGDVRLIQLAHQAAAGAKFTTEQRQWLDAIRDHIANSLSIERDDFDGVPFSQIGGLGRAYELFGDRLPEILEDLIARLAA